MQTFLTVAESLVKTKYPNSAKVYLRQSFPGFDIEPVCRVRDFEFLSEDLLKLQALNVRKD